MASDRKVISIPSCCYQQDVQIKITPVTSTNVKCPLGYQDLIVNGDFKTSAIYWNNGDGTFTEGTEESGVGTDENGMGSTVGDYDLDGLQDWFLTSIYMSKEQMEPFREVYLGGGIIFGNTGNRLYR